MGDGRVALILDVLGIGQRSGVFGESREQARVVDKQKTQLELEQQRLLLFRAGSFDRLAVPLSLVARLEEFPQSAIEHAGGGQVVQYRSRILPLVSLRDVLEPGAPDNGQVPDPVQVVVFNDGDRSVGMVVDEILDVAEEAVTVRQKSNRKGLLGSAVIGKRVTDFLDLNEVLHACEGNWEKTADGMGSSKKILVADASAFSRGMLRSSLDMVGYEVLEAACLDDAIHWLEKEPVNVVVAALDLPPNGSSALLAAVLSRPEWEKIPVMAVADSTDHVLASAIRTAGFQDCQSKTDSVAILEAVARLVSTSAQAELTPECVGEKG
jgi:two-component system chemotaxis sensor kinase CheA